MTKSWCVGGRHYSESINQNTYEKLNTKTKKLVKIVENIKVKIKIKNKIVKIVKIMKEKHDFYGRNKSQIFTK